MNQVPYLGSYGYVAPVTAAPSFGKKLFASPYFWLGLVLFIIGVTVYRFNKGKAATYPSSDHHDNIENESGRFL